MGKTDTSVIPTDFFSVANTRDGNWNKNENDTNWPIISFSIDDIGVSYIIVSISKFGPEVQNNLVNSLRPSDAYMHW